MHASYVPEHKTIPFNLRLKKQTLTALFNFSDLQQNYNYNHLKDLPKINSISSAWFSWSVSHMQSVSSNVFNCEVDKCFERDE